MKQLRVCAYCDEWSVSGFCPNHRHAPDLNTPACEHYVQANEAKLKRMYMPDGIFDIATYSINDRGAR